MQNSLLLVICGAMIFSFMLSLIMMRPIMRLRLKRWKHNIAFILKLSSGTPVGVTASVGSVRLGSRSEMVKKNRVKKIRGNSDFSSTSIAGTVESHDNLDNHLAHPELEAEKETLIDFPDDIEQLLIAEHIPEHIAEHIADPEVINDDMDNVDNDIVAKTSSKSECEIVSNSDKTHDSASCPVPVSDSTLNETSYRKESTFRKARTRVVRAHMLSAADVISVSSSDQEDLEILDYPESHKPPRRKRINRALMSASHNDDEALVIDDDLAQLPQVIAANIGTDKPTVVRELSEVEALEPIFFGTAQENFIESCDGAQQNPDNEELLQTADQESDTYEVSYESPTTYDAHPDEEIIHYTERILEHDEVEDHDHSTVSHAVSSTLSQPALADEIDTADDEQISIISSTRPEISEDVTVTFTSQQNNDKSSRDIADSTEVEEKDAMDTRVRPVRISSHDRAHQITEKIMAETSSRRSTGRGGYDPEADARVSAIKYRFRQRTVLLLSLVTIASVIYATVTQQNIAMQALFFCPAVVLAVYMSYLRRTVRIEESIRRGRKERFIKQQEEKLRLLERKISSQQGMVVVDIDDEDPIFDHLEYHPGIKHNAQPIYAREKVRVAG